MRLIMIQTTEKPPQYRKILRGLLFFKPNFIPIKNKFYNNFKIKNSIYVC